MIPAWTPNNSIFRDWARLVCTKLPGRAKRLSIRAHCRARHQSIVTSMQPLWDIIIWSMSIHKRQCSAACKTAASNCSSERPSHVVDVRVIRTLLWTLHRSYMIERKASGYIHRFHGHRRFMHTWMHQSVRRMHTFNVSDIFTVVEITNEC